ncbi:hypothetical protein ACFSJ3_00915 [Corallincola platygyrae]|uniref:Uncharacterized protein n=1 Tax=Corallincola platygyrae TaxID=1193278 RepID=A0ABW4XG93_9GAMM
MNDAASHVVKFGLLEECGEEDTVCIEAVESQFDACHEQFKSDWNAYMDAAYSEEDVHLERYSKQVFNCIVDADGDAIFFYDPQG